MNEDGLLLDTCVIFFMAEGRRLTEKIAATIESASIRGTLHLSPISAWEIARAVAAGRTAIASEPLTFFRSFNAKTSANLCDMGLDILVASSFLPGRVHKDPFDRILIETARSKNLILVTSDRAILAYGAAGHVKTLAC